MPITHESSDTEYKRLLGNPKFAAEVPVIPLRKNLYSVDGKNVLALVCSDRRRDGILEALRLMGGVKSICSQCDGDLIIKPNCNMDEPFPRDTHPETVRIIAETLIESGFPPERVVVGDMSGRFKGLPTRQTMANLGLTEVARDLGIGISCFEEEEWVTVKPQGSKTWPDGIRIPRRIYEAGALIAAPIMRPHAGATFSMALKGAVGLIDATGREWLHNERYSFCEKVVALNLAFSTDLVVMDGLRCFIDRAPTHKESVEPGVIIVSGNRVAADAVGVSVMKAHGAFGIVNRSVLKQEQLTLGEQLGLGSPRIKDMTLRTANLAEDEGFDSLVSRIKSELS